MSGKFFSMNNGERIPSICFGTWQIPDGKTTVDSVKIAIEAGFRHIDCAVNYANEKSIGVALKECGVKRSELFITSKLLYTEHSL